VPRFPQRRRTRVRCSQARARERIPAEPAPSLQGSHLPGRLRLTVPVQVAVGVFALWLLLAVYALARLTAGLMRLEALKRDALPLPVAYRDSMPQWLSANKGARDVRLCVSDETDVPIAVGLFDAMILIPRSLLDRLSEPEVDQICLHELAHLRRADDWTNGMQRVINALLGWNPATLFVGQQLDLEREVACDDWVLSFSGKVRPYALCLTKMAESASWPRHPIPAPGVFATRKHISLRIERLLGAGRNIATNLAVAPAAAAVAVVGAIALAVAVVAPSIAAPTVQEQPSGLSAAAARPAKAMLAAAQPTPKVIYERIKQTAAPARVSIPATHAMVPATHLKLPPTAVNVPATHVDVPGVHVAVPGVDVSVPETRVNIPKVDVNVPSYLQGHLHDQISAQIDHAVAAADAAATASAQSERECAKCDFSGVDWAGRDLRGVSYNGVDFSNANLARVNFAGGSFDAADFSGANLAGASFRNARLSGCDFGDANLSGADFSGAQITHCDFSGEPNLHGVSFRNAKIAGSDFSNARLEGVDFTGASLSGCDLDGVDLKHVDFSKARISGSPPSDDGSPP
jgi:uncharacterized protein YjbI with pentapeptide repeats/beta-lactamase regulating signal transducer with metallopeptidase domain